MRTRFRISNTILLIVSKLKFINLERSHFVFFDFQAIKLHVPNFDVLRNLYYVHFWYLNLRKYVAELRKWLFIKNDKIWICLECCGWFSSNDLSMSAVDFYTFLTKINQIYQSQRFWFYLHSSLWWVWPKVFRLKTY